MQFMSDCCCANDASVVPIPLRESPTVGLSTKDYECWNPAIMIQHMTRYPRYNPQCVIGIGSQTRDKLDSC